MDHEAKNRYFGLVYGPGFLQISSTALARVFLDDVLVYLPGFLQILSTAHDASNLGPRSFSSSSKTLHFRVLRKTCCFWTTIFCIFFARRFSFAKKLAHFVFGPRTLRFRGGRVKKHTKKSFFLRRSFFDVCLASP